MIKKIILFFTLIFALAASIYAQSGCPDCVISLPEDLPEDTIFLSTAFNGQVGVYYEEDISFRMPKTTDPVSEIDPDVPSGLPIESITINSLTNVPPGLNWELSQTEFDLEVETDGCVRLCGTPLQPGPYQVEVVLTATVFFIEETTSFSFPLFIEPATSTSDGFTITNNSGCGEVSASFTNNIPSDSLDGFSYFWDFGNGISSTEENPTDQSYTQAGTYTVDYQAIVDTSGYFLTAVNIIATECSDIFNNAPDLKFDLINPNDSVVFTSNIQQDQTAPTTFNLNIPIDTGLYSIRVVDDDGGIDGSDDICGIVSFEQTIHSDSILENGDLLLSLDIFHPIDTVRSTDSVFVFQQPIPPIITNFPFQSLCQGDEWILVTDYEEVQWYLDSLPILGATSDSILIHESGAYYLTYTSPEGCTTTSETVDIVFNPLPLPPVFVNENNLLSVFNLDNLPENYSLQWFLGELALAGEVFSEYCIPGTGTYTLVVTDLDTGCESIFSSEETFNPEFPNCVSSTLSIDEILSWTVAPNPFAGSVSVQIECSSSKEIAWRVVNILGQRIHTGQWHLQTGSNSLQLDLSALNTGIYFLQLMDHQQQSISRKIYCK